MNEERAKEQLASNLRRKEALQQWLEHPMTRLAIGQVETKNEETLSLLLEATHNNAWDCGTGHIMGRVASQIMEQLIKKHEKPAAGVGEPDGSAGKEAQPETGRKTEGDAIAELKKQVGA